MCYRDEVPFKVKMDLPNTSMLLHTNNNNNNNTQTKHNQGVHVGRLSD